jgi:hypothetical protein
MDLSPTKAADAQRAPTLFDSIPVRAIPVTTVREAAWEPDSEDASGGLRTKPAAAVERKNRRGGEDAAKPRSDPAEQGPPARSPVKRVRAVTA